MTPVGSEWERTPARRLPWRAPAAVVAVLVAVALGALVAPERAGRLEVVAGEQVPTTPASGPAPAYGVAPAGDALAAPGTWIDLPDPPVAWTRPPRMVWTGREVLAWGAVLDGAAGAALDPLTRSWRVLPGAPLEAREGHVAVWAAAGDGPAGAGEMIVLGGRALYTDPREDPGGAAYDPRMGTWRTIADAPMRVTRGAQAAWTGEEVVVVTGLAGASSEPAAAAYDPRADSWRPLPGVRPGAWLDAVAWTGSEALVVLGQPGPSHVAPVAAWDAGRGGWDPYPGVPLRVASSISLRGTAGGAIMWSRSADGRGRLLLFDPATRRWTPTSEAPLSDRTAPSLASTGRYALVWGGSDVTGALADAALYDLARERWYHVEPGTRTAVLPLEVVWADRELVVVGYRGGGRRAVGAAGWVPPAACGARTAGRDGACDDGDRDR
jgi:hypothetical protein